jgi:hypothetical protein
MSKPVAVAWSETAEELERRHRGERDVERRKRLGALWRVRVRVGGRTVERWLG